MVQPCKRITFYNENELTTTITAIWIKQYKMTKKKVQKISVNYLKFKTGINKLWL